MLTFIQAVQIAVFIGFQELRVPWARKDAEEMYGASTKKQVAQALIQRPDLLPDVPEEIRDCVARGEGYEVVVDPSHSLTIMLQIAPVLASWYELFKWTVLKAPDGSTVITSDNPVIKRAPEDSVFDLGVMNPDIEIAFPLSSSDLLLLGHDTEREHKYAELRSSGEHDKAKEFLQEILPVERRQIDESALTTINRLVAEFAESQVYAQTELSLCSAINRSGLICGEKIMPVFSQVGIRDGGRRGWKLKQRGCLSECYAVPSKAQPLE